MLTIRDYKKAASLEEAWQLNQKRPNRVLGGMLWMKMTKGNVMTAVDLSDLGLNTIEENDQEFIIGAMVPLRDLELHEGLEAYTKGAMKEALRHIVGVQFRNLATVGGSVFGRFGFSDVITMLLALDTYVEMYKGGLLPLREFVNMPYDRDILVRLIIKKEAGSFYYQSVRNSQTDFPVLACGAALVDGRLRLTYGARPSKAMLLEVDKELLAKGAEAVAAYAEEKVPTGSNNRGSAAYRSHLVGVLTKRAVVALGGK